MEQFLQKLPPKPKSVVAQLVLTTMIVGFCFLMVIGVQSRSDVLGFYLLFPAIFLAAVFFDRGAGIYATALSSVLLYVQLTPSGSFVLPNRYILPLVAFVLVALALAVVSEGLRTAWERAAEAERSKGLLLDELAHRTKNNLAMVSSLLSLQSRMKANPETRSALEKAVARVQAIAHAHDHLRQVGSNGRVEMRSYLLDLCRHLGDTLRDVRPIAVELEAEEVYLPTEKAIPAGLIVNELVTNALKHAFPGDRGGTVLVTLKRESSLILVVADDGIGCPHGKRDGIGSRLTQLLAQQLRATITWADGGPGCTVRIDIPEV